MEVDSPAQHVAKLEQELRVERERRIRAERDRDEYQAQVHTLSERVGMMTSAASSAAGSAESAIRHIMRAEPVLTAADRYVDAYVRANKRGALDEREANRLCTQLVDAVLNYRAGAPS